MKSSKMQIVRTYLNEKQYDFIQNFAEKRNISKSEAIRIIIDMKRKQEERSWNS